MHRPFGTCRNDKRGKGEYVPPSPRHAITASVPGLGCSGRAARGSAACAGEVVRVWAGGRQRGTQLLSAAARLPSLRHAEQNRCMHIISVLPGCAMDAGRCGNDACQEVAAAPWLEDLSLILVKKHAAAARPIL